MTEIFVKNVGRPTDYTQQLVEEICTEIACSSKGIRKLCLENDHWPEPRSIYRWLKEHPEFCQQYARAKQSQIEALVDEILVIADEGESDYIMNAEGKVVVNHEHIQRAKLRIDTRKWLASKLVPKVYGDWIQTDMNVGDSDLQRAREAVQKLMAEKESK
jgi:hypothetical protein